MSLGHARPILRWMFRVTELVTGQQLRGTLAVHSTEHDEWRAVFTPDQPGLERLEIARPMLHWRDNSARLVELPSPGDSGCRDLGDVTIIAMARIPVSDLEESLPPVPTFLVRGRLPVTAQQQTTAVVSVRAPLSARGG